MNTMIERKRLAGKLRGAALAAALAGIAVGAVAVPAFAQQSWTTTRTERTYNYGYYPGYYYPSNTNTYYSWGPGYDSYEAGYGPGYGPAYPPPPAYGYYGAPAPGVTVGVPGFGINFW